MSRPSMGKTAVSMGSPGQRDITLKLKKAIQESQVPEHRVTMMEARGIIEDLRLQLSHPDHITITRERHKELIDIEQKLENVMLRIKHMQHMRH
jgi:hypothetical protein